MSMLMYIYNIFFKFSIVKMLNVIVFLAPEPLNLTSRKSHGYGNTNKKAPSHKVKEHRNTDCHIAMKRATVATITAIKVTL